MCKYDEAFTEKEMLEETGFCKCCKLDCPNAGKSKTELKETLIEFVTDTNVGCKMMQNVRVCGCFSNDKN